MEVGSSKEAEIVTAAEIAVTGQQGARMYVIEVVSSGRHSQPSSMIIKVDIVQDVVLIGKRGLVFQTNKGHLRLAS